MSKTEIVIDTSAGQITAELDAEKAPVTVENFLGYIKTEHFSNTIFHRVIKGFMVQGGGFDTEFVQKKTEAPIKIEADNGLKNTRGTLAMARTQDPNSATSQFYQFGGQRLLNYSAPSPEGWGYTVFGEVTEGLDVVDKIAQVSTGTRGVHQDVPKEDVIINSITLAKADD